MKRALLTLATGEEFEQLLEIALPSFEVFADRHGYEILIPALHSPRPVSWWKVPALRQALLDGYDEVLWIDADIVIVDGEDDLPVRGDAWQALVRHRTGDGDIPNCGLWLVRQPMIPILERVWAQTHRLQHGWWEQAALMDLLGWRCEPRPAHLVKAGALYDATEWLDHGWNVHIWDTPGPERPRFMHATMHEDRAATMREWAAGNIADEIDPTCRHRYPARGCRYCAAALAAAA